MKIWVDADACPKLIKDILFKAANRVQLPLILVANQYIPVPPSPYIRAVQVAAGFDVADNHIVQAVSAGELVITSDIPLAAAVVAKQALALNPRGELYTRDNVGQRLTMRNLMDELRGSGIHTGGPAVMTPKDRQNFANQLDRWLAGLKR